MRLFGVEGVILSPDGGAVRAFSDVGMAVISVGGLSQFDNTRYGHYRGLRWLILLRELFLLPGSLRLALRLPKKHFDIIHVNEITLLPLAILIKKILKIPMVVHVRSLQCHPGKNFRTKVVNYLLDKYADAIISIDQTVAATLAPTLMIDVVHNTLAYNPYSQNAKIRDLSEPLRVGFLGVLIPLKGIYELLEAIKILRDRGVFVKCLVAGENARELRGFKAFILGKLGFSRDVRGEINRFIEKNNLQSYVSMLGFVKNIDEIYKKLDVLCFPSHLNAAGRPVFEAAFHEVPSIVAVQFPLSDAVVHEVTGLAIPEAKPELIANAIQRLSENESFRLDLGKNARRWAIENFSVENSANATIEIYKRVLKKSSG